MGLRELGQTGVKVNPLGLGCMGMSDFYGPGDDEESIKVLERAIELGCTFWDTADMYGMGKNERLLSRVLKTHRDKIFLCTKFGVVRDEAGGIVGINGKPEYVREAFERSIKNLGVDVVDLYYQHRVDPNTPIEETVKAMSELVREGRVRFLGLSECSADILRRAYKVHPIAAVQMEYSPWCIDIERNGLLEAARELGVSVVCYSPLGRGFLTGAIKSLDDLDPSDYRQNHPRFSKENFPKNLDIVHRLQEIATEKGVPPSELILAWVLAQGPNFIAIPGTKRMKYLEENIKGGQLKLTDEEIHAIRKVVDEAEPAGGRYTSSQINVQNKSTG